MGRRANPRELTRLQSAIIEKPGRKCAYFARALGWSREKVARRLVTLNDIGFLLYEDDKGGLYSCDKSDSPRQAGQPLDDCHAI